MNRKALIEEIRQIGDYVSNRELEKMEKGITKDFNFVSASLSHFLPDLVQDEHAFFYMELMRYRSLAVWHGDLPHLVDKLSVRQGESSGKSGKGSFVPVASAPMIYCGYHLGSYRSIIGYMVRENLHFGLLLDKRSFLEQGDTIRQSIQDLKDSTGKDIRYSLFNAEDPLALISIAQWMRAGNSMVAYIDGNTGYGGLYNAKEPLFVEMDLLGFPFKCRKGIALLSYLMKVPIVPAISYFENTEDPPILEIQTPIYPWNARETKEQYILRANRNLFDILENKLRRYASQWEAWLYVHKFIPSRMLNDEARQVDAVTVAGTAEGAAVCGKLSFNKSGFGLFKLDEKEYLFNRKNYSSVLIPSELFSILRELTIRPCFEPTETGLGPGNLSALIGLGVFTQTTITFTK